MEYYFYDTDVGSMGGERDRFRILIQEGFAATSGPLKYGNKLGRLARGDTLLMYQHGQGILAVGTVAEKWDRQSHKPQWYYRPDVPCSDQKHHDHEYRIKVEWFDLSDNPIALGELKDRIGYTPHHAIQKIAKGLAEIEEMNDKRRAGVPATPEAADLAEPPDRVRSVVYRKLRDTDIARKVKHLHGHKCQICGHTIELPNGNCYAEAHHIRPLGGRHNGPDVVGNILCVCPNHHAELDYGVTPIRVSALRCSKGHAVDPQYVDYHNQVVCSAKDE